MPRFTFVMEQCLGHQTYYHDIGRFVDDDPQVQGKSAPTTHEQPNSDFARKGGPLLLRAFQSLEPGEAELHLVTRSTLPDTPGVTVYKHMQPNSRMPHGRAPRHTLTLSRTRPGSSIAWSMLRALVPSERPRSTMRSSASERRGCALREVMPGVLAGFAFARRARCELTARQKNV